MKHKTREQRRRARLGTAARVLTTAALVIALMVIFCTPVQSENVPAAADYLQQIGADNAQRAHVMALYEEWNR